MGHPKIGNPKRVCTKSPDKAIVKHLSSADATLSLVIKKTGKLPEYYRQRTHFETISRIIVGQQLSYRAAEAIWVRLKGRFPKWTPDVLSKASKMDLRNAGLSTSKAVYILELSRRIVSGDLSLRKLGCLQEREVLDRLGTIKGFGPWSMEMFLIFALGYHDVFSLGDAGLRRAITSLYSVADKEYEMHAKQISEQWKPFRSYACRYLWLWLDLSA